MRNRSIFFAVFCAVGACGSPRTDVHGELVHPALPATHRIEFEARSTKHNLLEVVDKSTGVEFTHGLELVESENRVRPNDSDVRVGRDLASPIELPEFDERGATPGVWRGERSWWVRAPGFAWKRVEVEHTSGRAPRVELEPAGDAVVKLRTNEPTYRLALRLAHGTDVGYIALGADTSSPIELDGFTPGRYRVSLEHRTGASNSEIVFRDLVVVEGRVTEVELDVPHIAPSGESMALSGTLRISSSWGSRSFSIGLSLLDSPEFDRSPSFSPIQSPRITQIDAETWSWDAGLHAPGHYLAYVRPFRRGFAFDYDPASASDFALVIPPAAQVCVKLVDRVHHTAIDDENVSWFGAPPSDSSDVPPDQVLFDPTRGGYCFTAPVGDILVCTSDAADANCRTPAHLVAGANVVEVEYAPFVRIRVFATDRGRRVAWPDGLWPNVVEQRTGKSSLRTFEHRRNIEFALPSAGLYTVSIVDDLFEEGRIRTKSIEVDALAERTVEVEVPLWQ